jgi:hypothetical protein
VSRIRSPLLYGNTLAADSNFSAISLSSYKLGSLTLNWIRRIATGAVTALVVWLAIVVSETNVTAFLASQGWDQFLIDLWAALPTMATLKSVWWFWFGFGLLLGFAAALWLVSMFFETRIALRITGPHVGAAVQYPHVVTGTVRPAGIPVQVLVYSNDRQWWPQGIARVDAGSWTSTCYFGNTATQRGAAFKIIAVAGIDEISAPVSQIPGRAQRSRIVSVVRS